MDTEPGKQLQWRHEQASENTRRRASARGNTSTTPTSASKTTNSHGWNTTRHGPVREEQVGQQQTTEEPRQGHGGGDAAFIAKPEILKILYTNIQSVFSKINELTVEAVDQNPDIILFYLFLFLFY